LQPGIAKNVLRLLRPREKVLLESVGMFLDLLGVELFVHVGRERRLHRDRDRPVCKRPRQLVQASSRLRAEDVERANVLRRWNAPPYLLVLAVAAVQDLADAIGRVAVPLAEDGVNLVDEQRRPVLVDQPEQRRLGETVRLDRVPRRQLEYVEQRRLPRSPPRTVP